MFLVYCTIPLVLNMTSHLDIILTLLAPFAPFNLQSILARMNIFNFLFFAQVTQKSLNIIIIHDKISFL